MENPYEMELVDGKWKLKEWKFTDVYTDLKRQLIEKGIPENEITFIHDANNDTQKQELFSKENDVVYIYTYVTEKTFDA